MDIDRNLNILVAEDSDFMQKLFVKYLNEKGFFNVIVAENGNDGIAKLQTNDVDLIISDWNMPDKTGLEFLQDVRKEEKYNKVPFIMATAQGEKQKQITAISEGANAHITKPFGADQLFESIQEALGIKQIKKAAVKERKFIDKKIELDVGHIQITDHIILGILKEQIDTGEVTPKYFSLNTHTMPGWNPILRSLENGDLDAAFVLAPIAMDLFAYKVPIKLVSLAHKNGSIMVRSKVYQPDNSGNVAKVYKDRIVNIPHKLSVHNMLAHKYLTSLGLEPGIPEHENINVRFEVCPPVLMPRTMMMTNNVAGFIVADPIGTNAITKGIAELEFLSASLWENHPCCIIAVRDEVINEFPDAIYELTDLLAKAGKYVKNEIDKSAEIAVKFLDPQKKLGLTVPVLKKVLNDPLGISTNDIYPDIEELDSMQRYMHDKMDIGEIIDLEKFIDFKFIDETRK